MQNWNIMRKKVFKKIEFEIDNEEIIALVRAERG